MTTAEAQRIANAASTEPNGVAFVLATSLGLRRGEELGLKWDDVDVDAGRLEVRRQLERRRWRHGCMNLQAPPAVWASWVRGHWTVWNKLHRVGDVVFDEDRSQVRTGTRPPVMASLRNTAIAVTHGIAAIPRRHARNPERAIDMRPHLLEHNLSEALPKTHPQVPIIAPDVVRAVPDSWTLRVNGQGGADGCRLRKVQQFGAHWYAGVATTAEVEMPCPI